MKRRILWLTDSLALGGAEHVLVDTLSQFHHDHFDALLMVMNGANDFPELAAVPSVKIRLFNMSPTFLRSARDWKSCVALWKEFRRYAPHLIHTQGQHSDLVGQVLGRLTGVPVFSTLHIDDAYRYNRTYASNWYKLKLKIEDVTIQWVDRLIVISHSLKRYAIERRHVDPSRIVVVSNAIAPLIQAIDKQTAKAIHLDGRKDPVIGFIGRIAPQKNLLTLVHVALRLKNERIRFCMLIVGDGPDLPMLKKEAEDLGIADQIVFVGMQKNVLPFFSAMDVIALPSFTEGLPIVILEAMSLGLPIVASAVGDIPVVIEHEVSGLLLREPFRQNHSEYAVGKRVSTASLERMTEELSSCLMRVLSEEQLATTLGRNARAQFQSRHSLQANVRILERLFEERIAMKSRSRKSTS